MDEPFRADFVKFTPVNVLSKDSQLHGQQWIAIVLGDVPLSGHGGPRVFTGATSVRDALRRLLLRPPFWQQIPFLLGFGEKSFERLELVALEEVNINFT